MQLTRWSYSRRGVVRGYFDKFPHSTLYFKRIRRYYFLCSIDWEADDPQITKEDRDAMNLLINREMGKEQAYKNRKSRSL